MLLLWDYVFQYFVGSEAGKRRVAGKSRCTADI